MQPRYVESRQLIQGKRASVVLFVRLPQFKQEGNPIEACYHQGAEALERYIRENEIPKLEESLKNSERKRRLHRTTPTVSYVCEGEIALDRYWSVSLKLIYADESGCNIEQSYRVWDLEKNCLCPIELFLRHQIAKRYNRWEFALRQGRVWAMPKNGRAGRKTEMIDMEMQKNKWHSIDKRLIIW